MDRASAAPSIATPDPSSVARAGMPVPAERIGSVDALRGLVITLMIFVNDVAGVRGAPGWLKHARGNEDAMTLPDIVFPAFLFIAGMSIPLAFQRAEAGGATRAQLFRRVLGRTFALLVMGVLMENIDSHNPWYHGAFGVLAYMAMLFAFAVEPRESGRSRSIWRAARSVGGVALVALALAYTTKRGQHLIFGPLFNPADTQWFRHSWWGILGLIGWAYFVAATIYLGLGRRREWLVGATGLLMLLYVANESDFSARLASRTWLAWANPAIHAAQSVVGAINAHVSIGESLGSLAAVTMAGCCLGTILVPGRGLGTHGERLRWATVFGFGLLAAAVLLDPLYGLSKIRATPSWCFACAAITAAGWITLYALMDVGGRRRWSNIVQPAGAAPLLAYLLHPLLYLLADLVDVPLDFYHRNDWPLVVNIGGSFLMAVLVVQLTGWIGKTGYRLKV
jgi:heparan-alpha-glucosaminide N-acetyltransferase